MIEIIVISIAFLFFQYAITGVAIMLNDLGSIGIYTKKELYHYLIPFYGLLKSIISVVKKRFNELD